jgi:hypothetical protein
MGKRPGSNPGVFFFFPLDRARMPAERLAVNVTRFDVTA